MANRYTKRCATHSSKEICKSKPQGITSHVLEWLLSRRQEMVSVGKAVEKRDPCAKLVGTEM